MHHINIHGEKQIINFPFFVQKEVWGFGFVFLFQKKIVLQTKQIWNSRYTGAEVQLPKSSSKTV